MARGMQMVDSPVSLFHAEENGQGCKYWYAYASGADKYLPGEDGIEYHVQVVEDPSLPALRCTARIGYELSPSGS